MAGDFVPEEELNLKGFQKYFNSYTLRGRFNWACATYGSIFAIILCYKVRSYMKPKQPESGPPGGEPRSESRSESRPEDSQLETKLCRTNEYY